MTAFFEICSYFDISPLEFFDSDLKSPDQIHHIVDKLKLLPNEDLAFIDEALGRYLNRIQNN